jgi:hypothetical protein
MPLLFAQRRRHDGFVCRPVRRERVEEQKEVCIREEWDQVVTGASPTTYLRRGYEDIQAYFQDEGKWFDGSTEGRAANVSIINKGSPRG